MIFPATMQIVSTNIEPVARVTELKKGEVNFSQYGWGPLSFDEFKATLDDGWGEYPRFHKVQMEISTKSKANIIVGVTAHALSSTRPARKHGLCYRRRARRILT